MAEARIPNFFSFLPKSKPFVPFSTIKALAPRARFAINLLLLILALQIALGIATLLLVVPISLAATHQGGAVLLITAALLLNHALRLPPAPAQSGTKLRA